MGYDTIGSTFELGYTCEDPLDVGDPASAGTLDAARIYREPGDTPGAGEVPNPYSVRVDKQLQTQSVLAENVKLTRMPLGATCKVQEKVTLPPKYTDRNDPLYSSMEADRIFNSNTQYTGYGAKITSTEGKNDPATGTPIPNPSEYNSEAVLTVAPAQGNASNINSRTTFTMNKAKIKLRMRVESEGGTPPAEVLGSIEKIPVQLTCRYMSDPANPPETLKGVPFFPGMVISDVVGVPVHAVDTGDPAAGYIDFVQSEQKAAADPALGLEATALDRLATFPVGTHCVISTDIPENAVGYDPVEDGPTLAEQLAGTGWTQAKQQINSDMCAGDYQKYQKGGEYYGNMFRADGTPIPVGERGNTPLPHCSDNYTYLHTGDQQWVENPTASGVEMRLELVETIKRQENTVNITNLAGGDAAGEIMRLPTPMTGTLKCTPQGGAAGEELYERTFEIKPGTQDHALPVSFTDVPGDSTCEVSLNPSAELDANPNLEAVQYPAAKQFEVKANDVDITLETVANYKRAPLPVTHRSVAGAGLTTPEGESKVDAQVKQITAKCKRPDGSEVDPISVEVTNDRTDNPVEKVLTEADGRGLPYGTVCSFSTEYPNLPSDVIGKAVYDNGSVGTPSGPKNRVTVGDGAKMNITSTFDKVEANIMARVANDADNFNPADSPFLPYIDDAAKLRFECPGQEPVDIYVYDAEPIDVLPVDTDCTVTLLDPQAGGDESAGVVPYTVSTEVEFYVQNPGEAKPASQPVALAPGESYTFRSPAQGSQGFLSFRNTFSILKKDVNLNVSVNATVPTEKQGTTTATIWEADGAGMEARWVQALEATPASEALWLSYRCYYSETPGEALSPERLYNPRNPLQIAVEGSQRLGENLNATVPVTIKDVPRGATCEFRIAQGAPDMAFAPINAESPVAAAAWELFDAAKLDTTNSPGFYHGADVNHSAGNASPGVYTINDYGKSAFLAVTGDAAQPSEMNYKLTYDMLPAQFNVKMKVKGDGVAQVLPTKLLDTKFRCTLNGVPVTSGRTYEANPAGVWNDPQQTPEKLLDTEPVDPNGWSTLKASRFAVGAIPNQIAGIPAGAECEAFQTEASARIDDTSWVPTWEAGTGPMSRGVESRAQYTELAEPSGATSEAKGGYLKGQDGPVIKFKLPTKVTAPAGNVLCDASADGQGSGETCASVYGDKVGPVPPVAERFYGTITPWSEYTFNKTQLVIRKSFSGDGKELAENNDYRVHLTCYQDPDKVMVGDDELPTNQEQFEKTLELKKSGNHTAVFELLVPVHYTCTVSEFAAPTYDAKAETTFSSPSKINATETLPVTPQDPGVGQVARAAFVTNPALGGRDENRAQRVTVIDSNSKYERLRAALAVLIERDDKSTDGDYVNVGPGVGVESYDVEYDCVDPYLKDGDGQPRRYSGTVQAGNGQGPVEIKPAPNPEYDRFDSNSPQYLDLPAAAKCTITQQFQRAEGQAPGEEPKNPLDAYVYSPDSGRRNVQLDSQITISKLVDTEPYLITEKVLGTQDGRNLDNVNARPLNEKELKLSAGETTAVTFENRYQLRTANYSFGTVLEGLEGLAEIDGHQVDVTSLPFNFDVSCEYPNMPQNSTFAASGAPLNERFATHQNPAPENPDAKAVPADQATNMWTKLVPEGTACTVKPDFGEDAIAQMPKDIAMKLAGAGFRWDPTVVTKPAALRDGAGDIVLNPDLRGVERQLFTAAEALTLNADTPEQVIAYKLAYTDASELPMTGVPGWRLCFLALMLGLVAAALVLTYRSTTEPLCATRTRANTNSRSTFGSDIRSQNRNERKRE
ncbi:hypothetical protein SAMN05421878_11817 [Actinobaculum suis]|uniref:DUF5979 domain-containing protein n=1 Tax=Actinobaculum suis TaxID=1657 RepID=A0A1G7EIG5_9ACTO|nr:DUF5979 domain-containing protein [Actinobaculum suis]MDY5152557.1 DUF5979 domain-containing protein [Actinobaculum suis]SDE63471.1 hypothetical protein SAMN05421878_11817 [Actinobaculum suis]